tara:strand:+ start:633 stop:836 length:204 start_codon:yes stop_codon:yes gene_type:complete
MPKKSSTKRFGARYGASVREKLEKVEKKQKAIYKCPYCHKKSVKRESAGIWQCKKCDKKFTGKAYEL